MNNKLFSIEELELISPELARTAQNHGLKFVALSELLDLRGSPKHEDAFEIRVSLASGDVQIELIDAMDAADARAKAQLRFPDNAGIEVSQSAHLDALDPVDRIIAGLPPESVIDSMVSEQFNKIEVGDQVEVDLSHPGVKNLNPADQKILREIVQTSNGRPVVQNFQSDGAVVKSSGIGMLATMLVPLAALRKESVRREGGVTEGKKRTLPLLSEADMAASDFGQFATSVTQQNKLHVPAHYGVDKAPKEQVNYRAQTSQERLELRAQICETCRFLMPIEEIDIEPTETLPEGVELIGRCEIVEGDILQNWTCDLWYPNRQRMAQWLKQHHAVVEGREDPLVYQAEMLTGETTDYRMMAIEFMEEGANPDDVVEFLRDPIGGLKQEAVLLVPNNVSREVPGLLKAFPSEVLSIKGPFDPVKLGLSGVFTGLSAFDVVFASDDAGVRVRKFLRDQGIDAQLQRGF